MRKIGLIGVPSSEGTSSNGQEHAPDFLREAGIVEKLREKGADVVDFGDVDMPGCDPMMIERMNKHMKEFGFVDGYSLPFCSQSVCHRKVSQITTNIKNKVYHVIKSGYFPLTMGGDHSLSLGAIMGVAQANNKRMGVISADFHYDMFDDGKRSGCQGDLDVDLHHGNWLDKVPELTKLQSCSILRKNICVIGCDSEMPFVDQEEMKELFELFGCSLLSYAYIKKHGIQKATEYALSLAQSGTEEIYLSFDVDCLSSRYAPGTNIRGGYMNLDEAVFLCRQAAKTGKLAGADITEINPYRDQNQNTINSAIQIATAMSGL